MRPSYYRAVAAIGVAVALLIGTFFRYDYDVPSEPDTINLTTAVVLATELYSSVDEEMVWAIELTSPGMDDVGQLIDGFVDSIIDRLSKDRLISP